MSMALSETPAPHCPAAELCPKLIESFTVCQKQRDFKGCENFLNLMQRADDTEGCKRPFDTKPVPNTWVCGVYYPLIDNSKTEAQFLFDLLSLIRELQFPAAQDYFKSENFKAILDSSLWDEYWNIKDYD